MLRIFLIYIYCLCLFLNTVSKPCKHSQCPQLFNKKNLFRIPDKNISFGPWLGQAQFYEGHNIGFYDSTVCCHRNWYTIYILKIITCIAMCLQGTIWLKRCRSNGKQCRSCSIGPDQTGPEISRAEHEISSVHKYKNIKICLKCYNSRS